MFLNLLFPHIYEVDVEYFIYFICKVRISKESPFFWRTIMKSVFNNELKSRDKVLNLITKFHTAHVGILISSLRPDMQ